MTDLVKPSETDLIPVTALGATQPREEDFGALTISENIGLALASLTVPKGIPSPNPFGMNLPDTGKAYAMPDFGAFWVGPSQWMIEASGKAEVDFAKAVKAEAPDCAITEQTDGFTVFEILSSQGGQPIDDLMRKLVNIDPKSLGAGQVVRTGLEHMTVFLIRRSEGHLAVIGMRTLAEALWHALAVTARRLEE